MVSDPTIRINMHIFFKFRPYFDRLFDILLLFQIVNAE